MVAAFIHRGRGSQSGAEETAPESHRSGRNFWSNCRVRKNVRGQSGFLQALAAWPPHLWAFTQEKTTGIETMSIEGAPESHLPAVNAPEPPHARKRSWVRILVYLVLVAALGFIVWRIYQNQQAAKNQAASQAAALYSRPVPVQVTAAEQKPMPIFLTAIGTVTPYMSVTVKARVSGELEPVKFTEGQQVKQGETIMIIDPRPYKAALDQAKGNLLHDEALLKDAQAEYARYKALYEAGVTSKETLDADEATQGQYQGAIAADKAAIETAQLQLDWCSIQSPINGRIGLRLVDPGNIITANTTNLVIINQFQPIAVYFTLPEEQLPQVLHKLAAEKRLPVDAYDEGDAQKLASGLLLTADNQIDTTTGTDKLKAVFDNRDESLFPNQFVNIHLVMEDRPNALVVPSAAIQSGTQGSYVWVIDTDNVKKISTSRIQPVKIALAEGQVTILESGLQPGQNVVVDGADRLRPGQIVTATTARQRSGQGASRQASGQAPGQAAGPFTAPNPASQGAAQPGAGAASGKGNAQHDKREKQ
jgi:multidrug efflux system membrane fusion protein